MRFLLIYDSFFGNTQRVAKEIQKVLSKKHEVSLSHIDDFKKKDFEKSDILIIGSPTRAFSSSEKTKKFLENLESLKGKKFFVFDTRIDVNDVPKALGFMINLFGYADRKMSKVLKKKGGEEILDSMGFFVKDKEGPLKKGEIEKVKTWLEGIVK